MKTRTNLLKILPIVLISAITSCTVSSPDKIISNGVLDTYATEKEDKNKTQLKYTYQNLYDNYIYNVDNFPAKGNSKLLVIPVWFKDSSTYIPSNKDEIRSDIYKTFFGNEVDVGWRSVSGYYKQESYTLLNICGAVAPWYECGYNSTDMTDSDKTVKLAKEAADWYSRNNSDYKDFDTDNDGYIDGIALIYGAPDYSTYGRVKKTDRGYAANSNMWAYSYWIQESKREGKVIPNAFMWASYDFMYDSSRPKYTNYGYGDGSHLLLDTHTYIHEMGHILGLQDYYDYASNYTAYQRYAYEAAGVFSMQDNNVGGHDPFSKMALGWIKPYVVTDTTTITIKDNQLSGDVILISPDFENSPFDEYLLIELYAPTGLNQFDSRYPYLNNAKYQGPSGYGCRLWHVDARISSPLYSASKKEYYYNDDSSVGNDPTKKTEHGFENAVTNTTKTPMTSGYATGVPNYEDYRLLQLIRKNNPNYQATGTLSNSNLFVTGNYFSMSTYSRAFKNSGKLNKGTSLGYTISFDKITIDEATITITKI